MAIAATKIPIPVLQSANLFELENGRERLSYAVSTFAGKQQIQYDNGTETRTFTGEEILAEKSALGTVLTVRLNVVPDGHTDFLTLVLPEVLVRDSQPETFAAPVVFHTVRGSLVGPPRTPGAVQTYEVRMFRGLASVVAS